MEEWHFNKGCDENGGICLGAVLSFQVLGDGHVQRQTLFSLLVLLIAFVCLNTNADRAKVTLRRKHFKTVP